MIAHTRLVAFAGRPMCVSRVLSAEKITKKGLKACAVPVVVLVIVVVVVVVVAVVVVVDDVVVFALMNRQKSSPGSRDRLQQLWGGGSIPQAKRKSKH